MKRDSQRALTADDRGVLRFLTCGSVDNGKSTLIGRLLYDTRSLPDDTLATLDANARRRGLSAPDLALLTDGLIAEREQGITIDVAYRYFATAHRKYIIADAPGHEQYTRNMVTAASTADLAVLLVDVRQGVVAQTRRHATIAALLGVRKLVLAVNKMDQADWSQAAFDRVVGQFRKWLAQQETAQDSAPEAMRLDVEAIPLCALDGDNVVNRGERLRWHDGPTLVEALESAAGAVEHDAQSALRFPVQWVCRGNSASTRGYAGRIEAGTVGAGDSIVTLPGARPAVIERVLVGSTPVAQARAGQSVMLFLDRGLDISRGDMLVHPDTAPLGGTAGLQQLDATVCWLAESPLSASRTYWLRHATREVRAWIDGIDSVLDIQRLTWKSPPEASVGCNEIARVRLKTQLPIFPDRYREQRGTGSFILIDDLTQSTVAAGLID